MLSILVSLSILMALPSGEAAQAPPERISWQLLALLSFEEVYSAEWEQFYKKPIFAPAVKKFEKKEVYIKGYVIPISAESGSYVLSSNPFSSCFFCGGAGPETVIELKARTPGKNYNVDDLKTFKGTLRLNSGNPDQLYYIMENAEEYRP